MYGGAGVLDSRSDVVGGMAYDTAVKYADQLLFPDPRSATVVPWEAATARFICRAHWDGGAPLEASPRQVLERVLGLAQELGYEIKTGAEYEFYLLNGDRSTLIGGYHIFNHTRMHAHPVIRELLDTLPGVGVDFITANAEYGPGQFEFNWGPANGIAGPDTSYTFKNAVKEIAARHGLIGTFMSKPINGAAGCGAHFHISLLDATSGETLMGDESDPLGMSKLCRQFVAGNLKYARAIYSLLVPTLNCYKRRRPHTFSPSNISWGVEDRSALIRIKGGSIDVAPRRAARALGALEPVPGRRGHARRGAARDPGAARPDHPAVRRPPGGGRRPPRAAAARPARVARGAGGVEADRGAAGAGVRRRLVRRPPLRAAAVRRPRHGLGARRVPRDLLTEGRQGARWHSSPWA